MQLVLHFLFQEIVLFCAGAMGSVVYGIKFQQVFRQTNQMLPAVRLIHIGFHHVKTADEYIRAEPGYDIFDAFVRTAADENAFALMVYQQVLLMQKAIRLPFISAHFRQAERGNGEEAFQIVAGKE